MIVLGNKIFMFCLFLDRRN